MASGLAAILLIGGGATAARAGDPPPPASGTSPERWFYLPQPRPDVLDRLHAAPGESPRLLGMLENVRIDWDRLFAPGTLDRLIPPMQVAGIITGFVLGMPADELKLRLGQIAARHVAFDYVANPVIASATTCGGHTEGYDDARTLAASIERLRRIGVTVRYLSLDGGLFFGHYATGGQNCGLGLDETVRDVAITVNAFKAAWPDIVVGEILPTVPLTREADWQTAVRAYRDGLARATGKTLAFFELDIAWDNPGWRQSVVAETPLARQLGAGIAFIYNGDGEDRTDAAWLAHARRNIAEIEGGLNLDPVHVSFATWNPHPTHIVGPPGADTLQALMEYDALPGARLHLAPGPAAIAGHVTDAAGRPLGGYRVVLEVAGGGVVGSGVAGGDPARLPQQVLAGTVPAAARSVIAGLRINRECLCAGPDDLWFGDLAYEESGAGRVARLVSFLPDLQHLAAVPGPADPRVTLRPTPIGDVAHVVVRPDQTLLLNAPSFAVTPGAAYTLTVPVLNRLGTDMYGNVTLIWLDAAGHGLYRDNLVVRPVYARAGEAVTDAAGAFRLARPPGPVRLTVPDQKGHRAAIATLLP